MAKNNRELMFGLLVLLFFSAEGVKPLYGEVWPISRSSNPMADQINSPFGPRLKPNTLNDYDFHQGMDIQAQYRIVYSVSSAKLLIARQLGDDRGLYALYKNFSFVNYQTGYYHLDWALIPSDSNRLEGDTIALSGSSGGVPPHLHFQMTWGCLGFPDPNRECPYGKPFGNPVNVLPFNNQGCPYTESVIRYPAIGPIDSVAITVWVSGSELDVVNFTYFLYAMVQNRFEQRLEFQNFESFHNVDDAGNAAGQFVLYPSEPAFTTVITLKCPYFNAFGPHRYHININPVNSVPSEDWIGFNVVDLSATTFGQWCGTNFQNWGNTDGHTPTATISSFNAISQAGHVSLAWELDRNLPVSTVNIYRSETRDSGYVRINSSPILVEESSCEACKPGTYTFTDNTTYPGKTYYYRLEVVWQNGFASLQPEIVTIHIPVDFALHQNYPNPFNSSTVIRFSLPEPDLDNVSLDIFNMLGQKVRTLVDDSRREGIYQVEWNGTDDRGSALPSGIYFYRLQAGNLKEVKKLVLVK